MYCVNFRRSSLGIDYNRRSRCQSDCCKKLERRSKLPVCGDETFSISENEIKNDQKNNEINVNVRDNDVSTKQYQKDPKRQNDKFQKGQTHQSDDYSTKSPIMDTPEKIERFIPRNEKPISSEWLCTSEDEKRRKDVDKPNYLDLSTRLFSSIRKSSSLTRKATGFEKFTQSRQHEEPRRCRHSENAEEKKDDLSTNELDQLVWINQPTCSGDSREALVSLASIIQNNEKSASSNDMRISSSPEQQWRNDLKKSFRMLEIERNKKLALQQKLQNMEHKAKSIEELQSTVKSTQRIRKLEEEVAFYRQEFQLEQKKREESEEELQKIRQENQRYAEQMDTLIFEYIPNVAPKFKDIGPVNYTIEESFDFVGLYQIGEVLGKGFYGSVRRGSHNKKHQRFAIKILNKNNIIRFKDLKQIASEIHILKAFRHPNIIHLEEVIHATDNIYMVMELCFMDLHKYHSEIGLTLESARQVVLGILYPLHHLHLHGICHLDLKPENILLTKSLDCHNASHNDVRICDFGLVDMARKSGKNKDVIREGYVCGTPGFYAPEMVLQDKFEGRSADMVRRGLGDIFFKCVCQLISL